MARQMQSLIFEWIFPCAILTGFVTSLGRAEEIVIPEEGSQLVFVIASKAEIQSGPSQEFYPTAYAQRGLALEVYRKTHDGWLGVRPPDGSFSWVQAKDAYLLPGGKVIEVTAADAVSWIGTELGSAKQYRWQVALNRGEQLAVVGEAKIEDAEGNQALWYKVSPPAGEFRWIHESAVSTERPSPENGRVFEDQAASPMTHPKRIEDAPAQAAASETSPKMAADSKVTTAVSIVEPKKSQSAEESENAKVQAAAYHEDIFADSVASEVHGVPHAIAHVPQPSSSKNGFHGWHAFELTDDGLRFTLLEQRLMRQGKQTDPLERDPFSLEMPRRSGPLMAPDSFDPAPMVAPNEFDARPVVRRDQRWRDPRTLRNRGESGFFGMVPERGTARDLIEDIRGNIDQLGESVDSFRGSSGIFPGRSEHLSSDFDSPQDTREGRSNADFVPRESPEKTDWYGIKQTYNPGQTNGVASAQSLTPYSPASTGGIRASTEVRGELDELRVSLGEMVARPPGLWNLDPIVERTKYYIEHGANPVERGQARLLLERIQQFQEHARRSAFVPGGILQAGYPMQDSASPAGSTSPYTSSPFRTAAYPQSGDLNGGDSGVYAASALSQDWPAGDQIAGRQPFDATGWLVPVHATTSGQPTHALTNANGAVIAYVTALPGLNLDIYLNEAVGLTGLRGYLPKLQAAHIQAERIVRLK